MVLRRLRHGCVDPQWPPQLDRIIAVKPKPQTTPSLAQAITRAKARETVANYHFTPSLRAHFKRVFDCIVHRKGQGFWVQAEYGAGKTHFLGALIDLLVWRDADVWDALRDAEIKSEYAAGARQSEDVTCGLLAAWDG
jgi:hypothetical protein